LSEGPIQGLDDGDKSIYLNGTAILDSAGNTNFENYQTEFRTGTQDQAYITSLEGTEQEKFDQTGVLNNTDGTDTRRIAGAKEITITNTEIDQVRVTIEIPSLYQINSDGDILGYSVKVQLEVKYDSGSYVSVLPNEPDGSASTGDNINGKASSGYKRDYVFALRKTPTWTTALVRVSRVSGPTGSAKRVNEVRLSSYTLIIDEKLRYPNSAISFLRFDSRSFGNVPTRKYLIRGIKIKLPSNASVDTSTHIGRVTYSGTWDGTFGAATWCNDPAWCLYDLLISTRYGPSIPESTLDKWDFYSISQYCNELVSNGRGGQEPRFSCNLLINSRTEVYDVIQQMTSIFRGISYYLSGSLVLQQDKPADSQYILGPSNVVNGDFAYSGTSQQSRHSTCTVGYQTYEGLGEVEFEQVEDVDAVAKLGIKNKEVRSLGCYSQGQAHRLGKWTLLSEQNLSETVSFSVAIDGGIILRPGMIIDIADPLKGQYRRSGRISSATTTAVTVDATTNLTDIDLSQNPKIAVLLPTGLVEEKAIASISGSTITLAAGAAFSEAPNTQSIWAIQTDDILTQQFRVITTSEQTDGQYDVSALKYNSSLYNAIEQGLNVTQRDISNLGEAPGAVSSPSGRQFLYQRGQGVFVGYDLSWTVPTKTINSINRPDPNAASYIIEYRIDTDNWQSVETSTPSVNLLLLRAGNLEARIQARNYTGKGGTIVTHTDVLPGKTAPPGDVQNLTFEAINQNSGRLRWDETVDLDVKVGGKVFVRHSSLTDGTAIWNNSTDLIEAKAGSQTETVIPKVAGEIFVKFADSSGILSTNATSVLIPSTVTLQNLIVKNQREDQLSPTPFPGTKTDCNFDTTLDALELDSDGSGNVLTSGTYLFSETLDLGHRYPIDIARYFVTRGNSTTDLMDAWPDVDARSDWDGTIVDKVNASLSIRTTDGDPSASPTWGGWQPLSNGTFSGRAFQFKTDLSSSSTDQNILVDQLGYDATLDQRTEQSTGTVASGTSGSGKAITFASAFFTGTTALGGGTSAFLPSIGIVGQNIQSGDFFNVTNVSATGFTVKFENGSSVVNRNFTWTAVGFGRRV
jgi:predicted phage tail protein